MKKRIFHLQKWRKGIHQFWQWEEENKRALLHLVLPAEVRTKYSPKFENQKLFKTFMDETWDVLLTLVSLSNYCESWMNWI